MKAASPALINLLANSSQYAMWETFVFTLADGSTITYSTRDPDVLPFIPGGGGGAVFLQDTFSGSPSLLGSHVGEIGATWSGIFGFGVNEFAVEDGSVFNLETNSTPSASASGLPDVGSSYDVIINASFPEAPSSTTLVTRCFALDVGEDSSYGWAAELRFGSEDTTLKVYALIETPGEFLELGPTDTGLGLGGPYEMRVLVSQDRKSIQVFVSGESYGTRTLTGDAMTGPSNVGILIGCESNVLSPNISSIVGNNL